MSRFTLQEVAEWTGGTRHGDAVTVGEVGLDSRSLAPGGLFVAMAGERVDGHDFIADAARLGAAAALVEREGEWPLPVVRVADTRAALQALGAAWRRRLAARVVGVTGSNGKTTVKEMIAAILARRGATLATRGNLNNELGVPLTLLRLDREHRYAVIEMGANAPGEIARLTAIAAPEVAVITNAGPAHLEGFGDLAGVARAKGELFQGLPDAGVAVVNADDPQAPTWYALVGDRRGLRFGRGADADVRATAETAGGHFELQIPGGRHPVRLPLPGRHNVMNALAAAAVAVALEVPLGDIVAGLEACSGVAGRLQWRTGREDCRILDDTYNANPASLQAALDVLAAEHGERWLVLGDMGELGAGAEALHAEAGEAARRAGVHRLYAVGTLAAAAARAFGEGGRHFDDRDSLLAALRAELSGEVRVLVKGSRFMGMDRIVAGLAGGDEQAGES
ncbi:UDP-N-acetylmuramoyl-tripeptide--D-alanyl-D-alanine ligase [Alkalilimnicola ehrlichii]|uniref:UDP-N-acetylmuramoyl-tripeptide--D-alanyl-D- alanine ligase n=1 Tax=Alkalilimnicola ehrlichii TaxID=351052 RepID=UPI003BA01168